MFKPTGRNRGGLKNLRTVRWDIIEHRLPNILRLAEAVKMGRIRASEVLRRWHLYDEEGRDISEALREPYKVARTEFLLRYTQDVECQYKIRRACNDAKAWNSFHEAIFWGNGGRLRSNNPRRQEEVFLALSLLLNSMVFYIVEIYGKNLKKMKASTPVFWDHIQVLEKYHLRKGWFRDDSLAS